MHDEELRTTGITTCVSHGESAFFVLVRVVLHFALDGVARAASAGALRATALCDEARDDAVERETIVEAVVCQLLEVLYSARSVLVEHLKFHGAAFFQFDDRFFHMYSLPFSMWVRYHYTQTNGPRKKGQVPVSCRMHGELI